MNKLIPWFLSSTLRIFFKFCVHAKSFYMLLIRKLTGLKFFNSHGYIIENSVHAIKP